MLYCMRRLSVLTSDSVVGDAADIKDGEADNNTGICSWPGYIEPCVLLVVDVDEEDKEFDARERVLIE